MKNILKLILFITFVISVGCEKDDICIDATTPKLIIRFYDNANPTVLKKISSLSAWSGTNSKLYQNTSTDSIAIPLDINQNFTNYKFSSGTTENELQFTYTRNSIFISRSCGFKMNFNELASNSISATWIKNVTIKTTTIENETAAHINIYH